MGMAVALLLIVVASVLFHILSPWWSTPLASNWKQMDDTLLMTLAVTGAFFVAINLFVAFILLRHRHRHGQDRRAAYEPENRRLEWWLIGLSTLGIVGLLAPGLFVYANYVAPPSQAMLLEVTGQQWQWHFRFPGKDGRLGTTNARFVSVDNPLGLNPDDPAGLDDVVVEGNETQLPLNVPVKVLLRSKDVLHDFYLPNIRARMNMVPGMVTSFWFTPTQAGRFEVLCAQLCGVGHHNMRGYVRVTEPAAFEAWLAGQHTFAQLRQASAAPQAAGAMLGKALAQSKGCVACHSVDGSASVGPTWRGLFNHSVPLADGSTRQADAAYLAESIREPQASVVKGYPPIMPKTVLSDEEVAALVGYIQSLSSAPATTGAGGTNAATGRQP
jgi:cytochrome c oxidase subunit 2